MPNCNPENKLFIVIQKQQYINYFVFNYKTYLKKRSKLQKQNAINKKLKKSENPVNYFFLKIYRKILKLSKI